ncbi:hypothetical protein GDO81_013999 [Engystomops pustulosus]|uniref:Secreted protein n=1 Tax=Engystomops pustulosus TaxID=76066 RepID=A0AAV7B783_ENGPU|nr:hypothetical protein GDO81_013999 [Engystomops pustulosus]
MCVLRLVVLALERISARLRVPNSHMNIQEFLSTRHVIGVSKPVVQLKSRVHMWRLNCVWRWDTGQRSSTSPDLYYQDH